MVVYDEFQPIAWQTPHKKMLDKWQLGDISRDDLLDWAMWLDTLSKKSSSKQTELIGLICDETDDFLLIKQASILFNHLCEQYQLTKPNYTFADNRYGIDITENFYQQLLPMIDDNQLKYIAKIDYGNEFDEHYIALKKLIVEQNGKILYDKQQSWVPHEVLSLSHRYCDKSYEIAYVFANVILARNMLMHNNIFDDFSDFDIVPDLPQPLYDIIHYHIHYAKRLEWAKSYSSFYGHYHKMF